MYCTKCGAVVQEGAAFCSACGQPVVSAPGMAAEDAATPFGPVPAAPSEAPIPPVIPPPVSSYRPPVWPAASSPSVTYAGFWLRLVAYSIDTAILAFVFGALVAVLFAILGVSFFQRSQPGIYAQVSAVDFQFHSTGFPAAVLGVLLILIPVMTIAAWLYFALMESSVFQATPGKIALGLFVTDLQGRKIGFGRATGRFFARFITGVVPFFIGYIMAGFTEKRQALHDTIAGCLVLKKI